MAMLLVSLPLCSMAASEDDALPEPPEAQTLDQSVLFHLSLVFNQWDSGRVVPVTQRNGQFFVSRADLQRAGLPGDKFTSDEVNISAMNELKTQYDSSGQRLLMTVPNEWLPSQAIALGKQDDSFKPLSGSGALLNYDLYANHAQSSGSQASLWHELRMFSGNHSLSSTGTFGQNITGEDSAGNEGYRRYDTTLTGTDEDDIISWSAGDVVSDALSWSNSVRMGACPLAVISRCVPTSSLIRYPHFPAKRQYLPR